MIVLTKNQAYLVYKLGLAFGFSTRWQDYIAEFGGVLGGSFMWRQLARTLIGLIPVYGILPKVAVSYSGTYVVGNVVLQWYLTGRHISRKQMQQLYQGAFARGKNVARGLLARLPHPRLRRLPASTGEAAEPKTARLKKQAKPRRKALPQALPLAAPPPAPVQVCAACGRSSAADAGFCQYCGQKFQTAG
jgi:uncharacterized protein (DUF697 family)